MRFKKPAATSKSPPTHIKHAPNGGRIKLTVSLASSSSAKPGSSSKSTSLLVSWLGGARRLSSSASVAFCSEDVVDDGALAVLSDRKDSASELPL